MLNKVRVILLIVVLLFYNHKTNALHPFNSAVFNFELVKPTMGVCSIKAHVSDFNAVMASKFGYHLKIQNGTNEPNSDQKRIFEKYLQNTMNIQCYNKTYYYHIDSLCLQGEDFWLYTHISLDTNCQELILNNNFMVGTYPNQINLFIFVYKKMQKGLIFDKHTVQQIIKLPNN